MKKYIILSFLLSYGLCAGIVNNSLCESLLDDNGNLVACSTNAGVVDRSAVQHLENGAQLHHYLMTSSASYKAAYIKSVWSNPVGDIALSVNENGAVELLTVLKSSQVAMNGNGGTGGIMGEDNVAMNGNGGTGGIMGEDNVAMNGNGGTGGIMGLETVSIDPSVSKMLVSYNPFDQDPSGNGSTGGGMGIPKIMFLNPSKLAMAPSDLIFPLIAN